MTITTVKLDLSQPFCIYEKYIAMLTPDRQEKISQLKQDKDKTISFFTELLLTCRISERSNISRRDVVYHRNSYGKPFLTNNDIHFSISHSGGAIVIAEHDSPIGIDIEFIATHPHESAKRFFTENERLYIDSSDNKTLAFYEIWTAKEAYIKYLGTGLSIPFRSFDVTNDLSVCFKSFEMTGGYLLTLCAEKPIKDEPITTVSADELLEKI